MVIQYLKIRTNAYDNFIWNEEEINNDLQFKPRKADTGMQQHNNLL